MSVRTAPRYVYDAADGRDLERALDDLRRGVAQWRLAARLALLDLRNRVRGSVLGPVWITLSLAVTVAAISLVYPLLFNLEVGRYVPHLAVGLVVWTWMSQSLTDSCTTFTSAESVIRQMRLAYTVHVLRTLFRSLFTAALTVPVILVALVAFGVWPGAALALLPLGLAVVLVVLFGAGLFLGMVSARFRDLPPIVSSLMQLAFFLTPILWTADQLGEGQVWLLFNPFYPLLEIVRGPLVGAAPGPLLWAVACSHAAVTTAAGFLLFMRLRRRIAFGV